MSNIYSTNEPPIVQTELRQANASPQGVIYANYGYLLTDINGHLWIKQSPVTSNTGWVMIV
jgi:hypothetical protein